MSLIGSSEASSTVPSEGGLPASAGPAGLATVGPLCEGPASPFACAISSALRLAGVSFFENNPIADSDQTQDSVAKKVVKAHPRYTLFDVYRPKIEICCATASYEDAEIHEVVLVVQLSFSLTLFSFFSFHLTPLTNPVCHWRK
jgi:hypothetical protein